MYLNNKILNKSLNFIKKENLNIPISIDTRSSVVAEYALDNGIQIINDVSGFDFDNKLAQTEAKYHAGVIIQHSQGNPQNMQDEPKYENVVEEIYIKLKEKSLSPR